MVKKIKRETLFETDPDWKNHWEGMPEFFPQRDSAAAIEITVKFLNDDDKRAFLEFIGENPDKLRSIWWPRIKFSAKNSKMRNGNQNKNKYPIYIISKGRWESRLTAKSLDALDIPYVIVVEPQEYKDYAKVIDSTKILSLPFSNLGQGSIPARNWVWEHAIKRKATRYWILDDNIQGFVKLTSEGKRKISSGNPFTDAESFVDKYQNIALAGLDYTGLTEQQDNLPPYILNTRIYSCILVKTDLPHRWRGRYNEDTDLSLRILKDGWVTVLFNNYTANKVKTMTMKGGNTDELYKDDGRLKMAESLQKQHPDVVRITTRWNRPQHYVDYSRFKKNKLIRLEDK